MLFIPHSVRRKTRATHGYTWLHSEMAFLIQHIQRDKMRFSHGLPFLQTCHWDTTQALYRDKVDQHQAGGIPMDNLPLGFGSIHGYSIFRHRPRLFGQVDLN